MESRIAAAHYDFGSYVDMKRWSSYWHQVNETLSVKPRSVLEIGVGTGLFKAVLRALDCFTVTVDINETLRPDYVGSVVALPFKDGSFSAVVAFQVLEHLPYDEFRTSVAEMARVSSEHVLISLPDSRRTWTAEFRIGRREMRLQMNKPRWRIPVHGGRGSHRWEISKRGFPVERIVGDIEACGLTVMRNFRAPENPYHRFFVCRK